MGVCSMRYGVWDTSHLILRLQIDTYFRLFNWWTLVNVYISLWLLESNLPAYDALLVSYLLFVCAVIFCVLFVGILRVPNVRVDAGWQCPEHSRGRLLY